MIIRYEDAPDVLVILSGKSGALNFGNRLRG